VAWQFAANLVNDFRQDHPTEFNAAIGLAIELAGLQ
jgi:hypothetical protein